MQDPKLMSVLLEGKTSLWLPLLSGSMAPHLLPGDELYIEPHLGVIKRGDIAIFFAGGRFFSHRVLFSLHCGKKGIILEKGDANRQGRFLSCSKVIAKVTRFRRNSQTFELIGKDAEKKGRRRATNSYLRMIFYPYINFIKRRFKK